MRCSDVIKVITQIAPLECALEGDPIGFQIGRTEKSVSKILIALELTEAVADYALEQQADMIVTHHPFFFNPVSSVTDSTPKGRILIKLLRNDISVYSAHTNYDCVRGGMADKFIERLGYVSNDPICDIKEVIMPDGKKTTVGIGRVVEIFDGISLTDLCAKLKAQFGIKHLEVYKAADKKQDDPVFHKIAVCPGSGRSAIDPCLALGAEILVTADVTYHNAMDAVANGLTIVNAGHYGMESIFMEDIEKVLYDSLSSEVEIVSMPVVMPNMFL